MLATTLRRGRPRRRAARRFTPFSPCGRGWREAPDEGSSAVGHPQPLSRKGRGKPAPACAPIRRALARPRVANALARTALAPPPLALAPLGRRRVANDHRRVEIGAGFLREFRAE